MILSALQNRVKTLIDSSYDFLRVQHCRPFSTISYIITSTILLFLAQTKVVTAEESIYDEHQNLKVGTINRSFLDDVARRTNNINGVKYEVMEVRDQLNDIIANPVLIEENANAEDTVVIQSPKTVTPVIPVVQKTEVIITEYSKPKMNRIVNQQAPEKPIAIPNLTLLPTKKVNVKTITNNIVAVRKSKHIYHKHDIGGILLDHDTEKWSCVHDTQNNLMWEVKSDGNDLRNSNNLYSWFKPDDETTNGIADGGRCQGDSECDTNAYVQAMNEQNFCGHNDWQLPTREQMQTLVYLKNDDKSATINKNYFPETAASWYWTASENNDNNQFAWYILFRNGISLNDLKERPKHIRLVRKHSQQIASYK
ncbi:MAG: hypothetical protein DRQ62_12750 [Gammaproteobacteria bacterium]|nr:MAG: hypothetical protein DRQ62_12750 [Gammaproteobacteria bacterium]